MTQRKLRRAKAGLRNSPPAVLAHATRAHLAGDLAAAESSYRRLLELTPNHAVALNNLATILAGRTDRAGAVECLQRAIAADPSYGEAFNNLGLVHNELGDGEEARRCFARATELDPANPDWLNNHGNACVQAEQFEKALTAYDAAIARRPAEPTFWSNRGVALRGVGRNADAVASFERALSLHPDHIDALCNLALVHREARQHGRAITLLNRAIAVAPGRAALLANLATVYEAMADFEQMRLLAERALALDPQHAEAYTLLANHALEAGRYDDAERLYQQALSLSPGNRNAQWNLAIIWLTRGDFARGWKQFECRKYLQSVSVTSSRHGSPEWDGSPLDGRSILITAEQGIGDAIQFVRYARELKRAGAGSVVIECAASLVSLFKSIEGVDDVVQESSELPPADTHVRLMSLPHLLGTTLETIPGHDPYIVAPQREAANKIQKTGDMQIGIVWAGNPAHKRDGLRSTQLERFAPLFDIPGTRFFSLQKGDDAGARLRRPHDARLTSIGGYLNDFADTAAAIGQLDLVITVDTSVAHLAGAMGKPTWILLPAVADYRWLLDRADSPWYPTVRLFRQHRPRDWNGVFEEVEQALRALVAGHGVSAASPPAADLLATLDASTRRDDGMPRFSLTIPIALLNDPAWFAAFESELVGEGHRRALRDYWDLAAHAVDVMVDLTPATGIMLLSLATAPGTSLVIAVEPDEVNAARLTSLARDNGVAHRVTVVGDVAGAVAAAASCGGHRVGVHADDFRSITRLSQAWPADGALRLERLSCPAMTEPLPVVPSLEAYTLLRRGNELVLAPAAGTGIDIVWQPGDLQRTPQPTNAVSAPAKAGVTRIGLDWELRSDTGWGVYGSNLAAELVSRPHLEPVVFDVDAQSLSPLTAWRLERVLRESAITSASMKRAGAQYFDGLLLHALGNNCGGGPLAGSLPARRNAGVIFFEDTVFTSEALAFAASLDMLVAGCTWNADVLRSRGLTNVATVLQGIDPTVFHPAPSSGRLADRFVIFSGGKLEYRKGQDITIAAFRRFRERHPEALLVTAWHNHWPHLMTDLELAGHVRGLPRVDGRVLQVREWLAANGIPEDAVLDVGAQPNAIMGSIVREADVALFPNRAEGGTNLVAMECLAAGIPTIVSDNTGHRDLVALGATIPLRDQRPVQGATRYYRGTDGWGESSVDEIVAILEGVWHDRQAARALGQRAALVMQDWTWPKQIDRLLKTLSPLLA